MVYGKIPRGILSILRDNITGLQTVHPNVTGSVKEYCDKIINDLKISHELADSHCAKAQKQYVTHYNLRSRDESFEPGNQVLVLFPDSTDKLISKFQGPAIVRTKSEKDFGDIPGYPLWQECQADIASGGYIKWKSPKVIYFSSRSLELVNFSLTLITRSSL